MGQAAHFPPLLACYLLPLIAPVSPRDAITISRTLYDGGTLVDVSTSLPRSPDAPAYLRPAPPYVRSHVNLFAWCIQVPSSDQNSPRLSGRSARQTLKLTAFWSWDLKGAWLGMPAGGLSQQLPILMTGLVDYVRDGSNKLPTLSYYGSGVEVLNKTFDPTRDTLATEYSIVMEDEAVREAEDRAEKDLDALNALRERRRLEGCIEFSLPAAQGWDVRVFVKAQTGTGGAAEWKASAERSEKSSHVTLRLSHAKLETLEEFVKVEAKIQRVAASTGLRLNGAPYAITETEPRTPAALSKRMLEDTSSISGVSVATNSTDGSSSVPLRSATASPNPASNAAAIAALIRRNYIYFTSLLQEPEAKWKRVSDSRGVTVTQLDSIDPTLVVFRAEATFVGVGVWDLFSTINSPGARAHWDKGMEDARLLGDINDLSSLWHHKTKAAWPVR